MGTGRVPRGHGTSPCTTLATFPFFRHIVIDVGLGAATLTPAAASKTNATSPLRMGIAVREIAGTPDCTVER